MSNVTRFNRKNIIFTTVSLLMSYFSLFSQTQAATLYSLTTLDSNSSTEGFAQINQNFLASNLVSLESLDTQLFSLNTSSEETNKLLAMTLALSKADTVTRSALSFSKVVNSLKQLEFTFNKERELEVKTLPQVGFSDVYEGIYEFKNLYGRRPGPVERLVGDYLAFDPSAVPATELPKAYFYSSNSVTIGIAQPVLLNQPNEVSVDNYIAQGTDLNNFPRVQEGLKLNRVKPEEQKLDSTLQLWPRNPFATEVGVYGANTNSNLQQLEQFGNLAVAVNFRLIPRDILLNQLDLEVDWVNEGEYSNNLRESVERITEQNRLSQENFQNRVESKQKIISQSQQQYQRAIQNRMSQNFQNSSYEKQRNQQIPGLSRYQAPKINLNQTPKNLPLVPKAPPYSNSVPKTNYTQPIGGNNNSR
ncbi:hypothetical protein C7H19_05240 [Aphanothece hegewaldii CCALA 016]|uniref:TolC family protein n=1 Tax=Aphanothece hegewaldii CCALA 016 TaxID=2107694 RepID=A0A2T1M152_9CHRO|nr:hypothetical protein [Aphanothece hegewaldii]PSF38394.1 hypothetical protein C7H19_05240 [Aphanothece hegewaldii CCALA 016]